MATITKQTSFFTKQDAEKARQWLVVDAKDYPLGRLAGHVASLLKGKHKPSYQPNLDMGDHVVVLNASQVKLTGKKVDTKTAFRTSGRPGGAKYTAYSRLMRDTPEQAIQLAVKGMLPKGGFGKRLIKKMHVYKGAEHPHSAQSPKV